MEKKSKISRILNVILIIIIIILLLVRCKGQDTTIPTGESSNNNTVFDINVNVNYNKYILDENGNIIGVKSGEEAFHNEQNVENSGENGQNNNSNVAIGENNGSGNNGATNGNNNNSGNQTASENGAASGENGNGSSTSVNANPNGSGEGVNASNESGENVIDGSGEIIEIEVKDRNGYVVPTLPPKDNNIEDGQVYVDDKNGNFIYQKELDIFSNSTFKGKKMIAPGVSGEYRFTVHNSSKKPISYSIQMVEKTQYPVNMKYRLKNENAYVIGSNSKWVSAKELVTSSKSLKKGADDEYLLEWQWMHSDEADTVAGSNMTTPYQLTVSVYFEVDD